MKSFFYIVSEKSVKKKKKKKAAHIISFDEDDSGTFSSSQLSEADHLEISGSRDINNVVHCRGSRIEAGIVNTDERSVGEGVEDRNDSCDSSISIKRSLPREPSIASASSCDHPPSHGSFSSTDYDLGYVVSSSGY